MISATSVPIQEYLRTTYRPDVDYVDGELVERNVGEFDHSSTQTELAVRLHAQIPAGRRRVLTEQRVQVRATRYRIPDVCVLAENAPREAVVGTPPELCVEILSKDDRMSDILERVRDYFDMGVPVCWIIDPVASSAWTATPGRLTEATDGVLRAGTLEVRLLDILESR